MATISKTSTFEVPKFSPSFSRRWVFCPWLGLGPRLPRPNTAALRSQQRPRFRGPAASRGEGSRGCGGRNQPWPRRRILGGNLLRPWDSVAGEENQDVDGSSFWWIFFRALFVKSVSQKTFAPTFTSVAVITIVSLPTPRVGVSLNQGSQFGKMFLSFRSVHSDVVYNQALLDRIIICRSQKWNEPTFFQFIYELGLLRDTHNTYCRGLISNSVVSQWHAYLFS